MKKIIKKSLKKLLSHKIKPSKRYAKNILIGLELIHSKYGLFEDKGSIFRFKYNCAICNEKHDYSITSCNIPQSINAIGISNIKPFFICRYHNLTSELTRFYESIISDYRKSRIIPYGYYIVKKPFNEIFCEKLLDIENFIDRNDLDVNSMLKVFYTKTDVISIFSNDMIIQYPTFEYVTSREHIEYETRQYNVDFADFNPDNDIMDYKDYDEYNTGDSEYETDYNSSGSEEQTDMNIEWSNEYSDLEQYLSETFLETIKNLRKNQKLEI